MSENLDHISPKAIADCVDAAWDNLKTAIALRDKLGIPAEVLRVARALCEANGGDPDALVHTCPAAFNGVQFDHTSLIISTGYVRSGWGRYVHAATIAIESLDLARAEESLRLKQQEETIERGRRQLQPEQTNQHEEGSLKGFAQPDLKAVDIPVGFSGMNNCEDVKFVAIDPSNPNRVTDSLSHSDLAAMVEFLATIFDEGPDGDSAICRQTGKEFFTVKMGYKGDGKQSPEVIRKWLIRWATLEIVGKAPMVDGGTIYWRKRPIIELERGVLKIYARVAFGP